MALCEKKDDVQLVVFGGVAETGAWDWLLVACWSIVVVAIVCG